MVFPSISRYFPVLTGNYQPFTPSLEILVFPRMAGNTGKYREILGSTIHNSTLDVLFSAKATLEIFMPEVASQFKDATALIKQKEEENADLSVSSVVSWPEKTLAKLFLGNRLTSLNAEQRL